ncbi:hypothetical protein CLOM_g2039 [Closterium sp. NIES-68]|nr:hypothetical protein CLOM_g2039 [Closterium sp. NIES-68]GJP76654.1 hypothetical protein CLOP_g7067 [Closterium sp. NIES-67]
MAEGESASQQPHSDRDSPSRPPLKALGAQGDSVKLGEGGSCNGGVIGEGTRQSENNEADRDRARENGRDRDRDRDGERKAVEAESVKARARPSGKVVHMARADLVNLADLDRALDRALSRREKPAAAPQAAGPAGEGGGSDADKLGHGPQAEGSERPAWEIDVKNVVLRKLIANGTFGTVYRGTFQGKDVAVKVLDWGEEDTMSRMQLDRLRRAFKQEVTVWSTLSHPNITQFVGASVADQGGFMIPSFERGRGGRKGDIRVEGSLCCLVVEYVPGGTLKDYLIANRRRKLPLRTVVQLAADMAKGLEYLHGHGVVHRDIKSENMLLTASRRVKVADFGVARIEAENPKDMTGATGTLGYMAPEVLDCRPYNHRADVYSFGICLWEIYCCDMPFPDLDFKEMAAVVNKASARGTWRASCGAAGMRTRRSGPTWGRWWRCWERWM